MNNFARTWRPNRFDDVVGQEMVVRLLKNSLYRNRLFPVYLFAGQRGCGKTTLARIFAAAVNCSAAPTFRERPHEVVVPCGACGSCQAMRTGEHPDFVEIDAASHTGVDHVRSLLEASALLPQMGVKKVYLIDEAHMLSKAAFNALLKTLEEPNDTTLFLLATTDVHKVIDTVRSRCFQLFLSPLAAEVIVQQLAKICEQESIVYEPEALELFVASADGALRDAINQLERVVIAYGRVTSAEVLSLVGMVSFADIADIMTAVGAYDAAAALQVLKRDQVVRAGAVSLWRALYDTLRAMVWAQHGVVPNDMLLHEARLKELIRTWPVSRLIAALDRLFTLEQSMLRSLHQQALLELAIVELSQQHISPSGVVPVTRGGNSIPVREAALSPRESTAPKPVPQVAAAEPIRQLADDLMDVWVQCMSLMSDPAVISLARQAQIAWDSPARTTLRITLPEATRILAEVAVDVQGSWEKLLRQELAQPVAVVVVYDASIQARAQPRLPQPRPSMQQRATPQRVQPPTTSGSRSVASTPTSAQRNERAPRAAGVPAAASKGVLAGVPAEMVADETTQKMLRVFQGTITKLEG